MAKAFTFQLVIHAIHAIHSPFTHFALYAHLTDIHIVDLEIVGFDSFEEAPKLHCKYHPFHLLIAAMLSICHLIHCLLGLKRAEVEVQVHVHENRHYISCQSLAMSRMDQVIHHPANFAF